MELRSPALVIRFPAHENAVSRDRLVALLAEHDLVAIQEDQIDDPREWTAHFASVAARDDAATALAQDAGFSTLDTRAVEVEDEDWARRTQADLPAVTIGRVRIAPPWDLPPDPNPQTAASEPLAAGPGIVVLIEPSRGFGTGHHQSTRLCLLLLQSRNLTGLTVADVGTGSGVLAISAAKLGAAFATAIDSDPDAIENARENIVANGVEKLVEAHVDDLTTTTIPAADLVLANLTGTLLSQHATDLARLVRPGGTLIVSGFNIDERDRVTAALTRYFDVSEEAEEDDWHAFVVTARRS
ncbi:MAG TPA: 50S ribosomal protein L11 methyltransferase [Vicinamibacterales bacterium]|nr:50S ribosomal protein L11 methyltransferase [Vicinamibacterales bacterium]